MTQYSEALKKRAKDYFLTKHGKDFSDSQIENHLDALADLYLAFADLHSNKKN